MIGVTNFDTYAKSCVLHKSARKGNSPDGYDNERA